MTTDTKKRGSRFYYAFKWQAVVDAIQNKTKGIVLIAAPEGDSDTKIMDKLPAEDKSRVIGISSLYSESTLEGIIHAANKPKDKTWSEWLGGDVYVDFADQLEQCEDSLTVSVLVLMDHGNRTKHLRRILTETRLPVISSTERYVAIETGKIVDGGKEHVRFPDTKFIYGRPPLPDFEGLTDDEHDRYLEDGVTDLDCLIPVYDFDVQTFNHWQVLESQVQPREVLVYSNGEPMLWSESITELFAWRGTGKTLLSLGLALHLAAGKSMPGLEIPSPRKVLYVEGELPASQLKHRIQQLSQGLGDISGFNLMAKSWQSRRAGQAAVTIKTEAGREAIENKLDETGATVLMLDSIASLAQIDTNNESEWIPIIEWFVDLRCRGICIFYLQQSGKKGEQRGHSVSEDRIDLAIKLTATGSNFDGAAFTMTFTKEREGSLTPLRLTCTNGAWSLDDKPAKKTEEALTLKEEKKKRAIITALKNNEPQAAIAKRLKTSLRNVSLLNKEMSADDNSNERANHAESEVNP
jgi:hypothetical protein